jgi:hypothetical protein
VGLLPSGVKTFWNDGSKRVGHIDIAAALERLNIVLACECAIGGEGQSGTRCGSGINAVVAVLAEDSEPLQPSKRYIRDAEHRVGHRSST